MQRQRLASVAGSVVSAALLVTYSRIRHQLPPWWEANAGGILYVLFWILFVYSLFPQPQLSKRICVAVVVATCVLEVLQLWNPGPLAAFRKTRFGAALIGTSFAWDDFPPYFLGGIAGWLFLRMLRPADQQIDSD